jgi:outer membrane murein-binding lipoprotein Lpp
MKNDYIISTILVAVLLAGCTSLGLNTKKYDKAKENVAKTEDSIKKNETKIEDKGKAFVYGANYANKTETNRTPAVEISGKFLDLAQITLGNPSVKDAELMRGITDGLLQELKVQLEIEKQKNASSQKEIKDSNVKITEYQKEIAKANTQLTEYSKSIINLQKEKDVLIEQLEKRKQEFAKITDDNSEKAAQWEADNSFWANLNPFTDLFSFFKKLIGWGVFLFIIFIVFKVLEVFFPGLGILTVIGSAFISLTKKLIPTATRAAGLVSDKVYDSLSHVVKSNHSIIEKLDKLPIEDDLIEEYPYDKQFSKEEVRRLLYKLTEKTLEAFKSELNKNTDPHSRAVIRRVKSDAGITDEHINVDI